MSEAASGGRKLLIVGAHSGVFVWRAAGAIAPATSRGEHPTPRSPTSENPVEAKFAEFLFHALGCIDLRRMRQAS